MKLSTTLRGYEDALRDGSLHVYATNSCYDRCAHCYMSAVSENSSNAKYIDTYNLLHFVDLLRQDKPKGISITLTGGDPLLHPEAVKILDELSSHSRLEVMTSGFALSSRNTTNRKELLESMAKSKARFLVASPEEPYHSITWDDISDIRKYIKEQGFNPNKLDYASKGGNIAQKVLLTSTIIGGVVMASNYLVDKYSNNKNNTGNPNNKKVNMPLAIPIGRAEKLPQELQKPGTSTCTSLESPGAIYVNYDGKLQYCIYSCHDGFMNIDELKDTIDKKDAIKLIIDRLSKDITFQDMITYDRCYFSKKIRKK